MKDIVLTSPYISDGSLHFTERGAIYLNDARKYHQKVLLVCVVFACSAGNATLNSLVTIQNHTSFPRPQERTDD